MTKKHDFKCSLFFNGLAHVQIIFQTVKMGAHEMTNIKEKRKDKNERFFHANLQANVLNDET